MMNYKGYLGILRVDEEEKILRGRVVNTRDMITFQGGTVEEAAQAFRDSVDDYLQFCAELGRAPEKPFSGTFLVRVKPELHRTLSAIAQARGTSVNQLVNRQLSKLARRSTAQRALPEKIEGPRAADATARRSAPKVAGSKSQARTSKAVAAAAAKRAAPAAAKKSGAKSL
jgi:predicted HicB family RNase H-like nuclease